MAGGWTLDGSVQAQKDKEMAKVSIIKVSDYQTRPIIS
jgi:hypothetical protein